MIPFESLSLPVTDKTDKAKRCRGLQEELSTTAVSPDDMPHARSYSREKQFHHDTTHPITVAPDFASAASAAT
jgi:hypothetical protein